MTRTSGISVIRRVPELRDRVAEWRDQNQRIALVPTMGALHKGHLALVKRALGICDRVIVSLFVNPTQFGVNEDLSAYPRDEAADRAVLEELGVHLLYAPTIEEMYPQGPVISAQLSGLAEGLGPDDLAIPGDRQLAGNQSIRDGFLCGFLQGADVEVLGHMGSLNSGRGMF